MQNDITELRNQVQELRAMVDSLIDQVSPDVIQAKRFEVVNDQKPVIVEMGQACNLAEGNIRTPSQLSGLVKFKKKWLDWNLTK